LSAWRHTGRHRHAATRASPSGLISGISTGHRLRTGFARRRIRRRRSLGTRWRDIAPGSWVGMKRTMCPDMRLGLALGRGWLRRLLPFDGGTLELSGVFGGRPSFASSSAIRATSASIRATSAAIKASFSAKSGRRCHRRLTHIRDVAATKKIQSQTPAHLHTIKRA